MNLDSPPLSYMADKDNSAVAISVNVQDIDLAYSDGMFRILACVAFIVLSSGSSTVDPLFICFFLSKVESHIV